MCFKNLLCFISLILKEKSKIINNDKIILKNKRKRKKLFRPSGKVINKNLTGSMLNMIEGQYLVPV